MEKRAKDKKDRKDISVICNNTLEPLSSIFMNDALNQGEHLSMGRIVTLSPVAHMDGRE